MKRCFCTFLIVALFFGVAVCCLSYSNGSFAYAASNSLFFEAGDRTVRLNSINDGHGVAFNGYYFGMGDIPVVAEIYSSPTFTIDFNIGESDGNLTPQQIAKRNAIKQVFTQISVMIDRVDALANTTYDGSKLGDYQLPTSDVYRYNMASQGDKLEIAKETYDMLLLARDMYEVTEGAFNPAVYRLVDLWGFSSRIYSNGNFGLSYDREVTAEHFWNEGYPLPQEKYVEAFSSPAFTDFSQAAVTLSVEGDKYYVTKNVAPAIVKGNKGDEIYQQWIDLGGIAKGYAVDLARTMIEELGIDRFYFDAGSSSIALGLESDGGKTSLGLEDAFSSYTTLLQVDVGKANVSTSGQNNRKYTVDGVEYAHILDGVTGEPAQTGIKSVMIIAPEDSGEFWATKGDCLTTALTVMGRDRIVQFVNGYLKEKGIKIVVQYQTLDNRKQLLTNFDEKEVKWLSDSYKEFGWALIKGEDGVYYYEPDAKFSNPIDTYQWILIVLGCVLGVAMIAMVVYHFVRGRKRALSNVQHAKKDKPFKVMDVMVYIAVVLLILVLFSVFVFNTDDKQLQIVTVVDDDTGETLFVYNVTRGEYTVNQANTNGWTIDVEQKDNGVEVTLTREIQGEKHFNKMQITRGRNPSVKMTDAICGFHKDCVRNFPAITRSDGAIVCSPNRLKIITQ